jgi:hypothetical protein
MVLGPAKRMAKKTMLESARNWAPDPNDHVGEDKRALIDYLLENAIGWENPVALARVAREAEFSRRYSKEGIQLQLMVPLRSEGRVFIGTGNKGIYLINEAQDGNKTIDFYSSRIRSELRHLRNLKALAAKYKLFSNYTPGKRTGPKCFVYFDESGTPTLKDKTTEPYFIVCGVLLEGAASLKHIDKRFDLIAAILGKPADYEFKSNRLDKNEYTKILKELAPLDFQWAAVCFVKKKMTSPGFANSTSFYRFAYQFIAEEFLSLAWDAELYFDEYSNIGSKFQREFAAYIKKRNAGLPPHRLKSVAMLKSEQSRLIQLADLLAGVVKNQVKGKFDLQHLVDDKVLKVQYWPRK